MELPGKRGHIIRHKRRCMDAVRLDISVVGEIDGWRTLWRPLSREEDDDPTGGAHSVLSTESVSVTSTDVMIGNNFRTSLLP